jgi:hypothetical protein
MIDPEHLALARERSISHTVGLNRSGNPPIPMKFIKSSFGGLRAYDSNNEGTKELSKESSE